MASQFVSTSVDEYEQPTRAAPAPPSSPSDATGPTRAWLRAEIDAQRTDLEALIRSGVSGRRVGKVYAALYDRLLTRLFRDALRATYTVPPRAELAAAGSYGRGTLAPRSDLDVRLLCDSDTDISALAECLLYPLWDAGVAVGHQLISIESVTDLALDDVRTASSLLDLRSIVGGTGLGEQLEQTARRKVFSGEALTRFIDQLATRTTARHERFGTSVYLLEPNVKSGAGGVRDLDVIHWLSRARFHVGHIDQLATAGVMTGPELEQLLVAREFVLRLRNSLHLEVRRCDDGLTYERQERLAKSLGYGATGTAVERLMRDYYCQARVIAHACEMMVSRCQPRRRRGASTRSIGDGLSVGSGTIWLDASELLDKSPQAALQLYWEAIERDLKVSQISREAISRATLSPDFCARLRNSDAAKGLFIALVCAARATRLKSGSVLTDLHDVGLLTAMIPEFAPVVGRVHRDAYHVHTVDVHSIAALDFMHSMRRGEHTARHRLACRVAAEVGRLRALCMATLLHDVGKCGGGAGHAGRGAKMAGDILQRFGFSRAEIATVQLLISAHLRMYQMATHLDVDAQPTIESLAFVVKSAESLRELYLLTIADVTTTSPTSMTDWKRHVIDDLFRATLRHLTGAARLWPQGANETRELVLKRCDDENEREFLGRFLKNAPVRYLHSCSPRTIVAHARFARSARLSPVRVALGKRRGEYAELWIAGDDRPGFLRRITAALHKNRMEVLRADVYSWSDTDDAERCFDSIWVKGLFARGAADKRLARLEETLTELVALDGPTLTDLITVSQDAGRTAPRTPTEIHIDNRTSSQHTVLEVITQDRPLLVYTIAGAFEDAGLVVSSAKLNTEGQRAIDVFCIITDRQGAKLSPSMAKNLKQRLLKALEPEAAPAS